jgi:hypothetical protein
MRDLVLIPTFCRTEYLSLCLEYLAAADGGVDKEVWISHDRHVNDSANALREIELSEQVANTARGNFSVLRFNLCAPHNYVGNPSNFLELYKAAYAEQDVRYVYLVEDDVIVGKDFFRWHEAVQPLGDYLCTVGWHCIRNPEVKASNDPTEYIESTRDFSSIGVCWKREKLEPLVRHATTDYYRDLSNYLSRAFPDSPIKHGQWTEQAGVITRLLHETQNRWVAWPASRRVAHVGVSGYHRPRGHRFSGDLAARVAALRSAVSSNIATMSVEFADDIESLPVTLDWKAEQLHSVQQFPYQKGKI